MHLCRADTPGSMCIVRTQQMRSTACPSAASAGLTAHVTPSAAGSIAVAVAAKAAAVVAVDSTMATAVAVALPETVAAKAAAAATRQALHPK
jgi:hypothetical protein